MSCVVRWWDVLFVKGINFHIEKISPMHIGMQNVRLSVCVSVCLSDGKNGITFDPLHEIN